MPTLQDIFTMPREDLAKFKTASDFEIVPDSMGVNHRLSIYSKPIAGHQYVAGADFALGVEGRDYDALVVADIHTNPVEQVAELEGRWGADRFDRLLYCMLRFYFNCFLVGERQVGLPVLRSLLNNFGYGYLYYNRDEASRGRHRQDSLGHHKSAGDPTIPDLRRAVRDAQFLPRSTRFQGQLRSFQFRPKGRSEKTEEMRDADLSMGAPAGEFDDLVNAGAYCWKAVKEVHRFEADKPMCEPGKAGDVLGMPKAMAKGMPITGRRSAFRGY